MVVLENLWIDAGGDGAEQGYWSVAGLAILGGQRQHGDIPGDNTYGFSVLGCHISGCYGDGILFRDDAGGMLSLFHSNIHACGGIGFNQVFGANGPGYKSQVCVEGNVIEGNSLLVTQSESDAGNGGQINCDSLAASSFKNNHIENSSYGLNDPNYAIRPYHKVPPIRFGTRVEQAWRGQYFGLNVTGNEVSSVAANWAVELGSTAGSIGIVVSGNCFIASPDLATNPRWPDNTKPIAAIVSLPQTNIEISGNMCSGIFFGKDYADYSGYWFGFNNSFRGQDFAGHQLLGDLRYGWSYLETDPVTKKEVINSHSHVILLQTTTAQTLTLPDHKLGKHLLLKNMGTQTVTLTTASGTIDGNLTHALSQYEFVELQDDGTNYWIVGR